MFLWYTTDYYIIKYRDIDNILYVSETTWDPPDNYVSLAQQEEKKLNDKEEQKRQKKLK